MKTLHDESIKQAFKKADRYEIKTTAEDILFAAAQQPVVQKKERKPFLKPFLITFTSAAAACAAAAAVIVFNPFGNREVGKDTPHISDILNPAKNQYLSDELLTFYAFSSPSGTDQNALMAPKFAASLQDKDPKPESSEQEVVPEEEQSSTTEEETIPEPEKTPEQETSPETSEPTPEVEEPSKSESATPDGDKKPEGDKKPGLDENGLGMIADRYEKVQGGIRSLFEIDAFKPVTIEMAPGEEFEFEGKTYACETRFIDAEDHIKARIYFNVIDKEIEKAEAEIDVEALYYDNSSYYYARIERETETGHDKAEEEVKTIMWSTDVADPRCFVMEKEHEFKGTKSEDSYSYTTFESLAAYEKDEEKFLSCIKYEVENGEINASFQEAGMDEVEFKAIDRIDATHYSFKVGEFSVTEEEKVENVKIGLAYSEDYATRTYSYEKISVVRK